MIDEKELRELAHKWRQTAMESVPDIYAHRNLHGKYLKLDNWAAGVDDCGIELLELLDTRNTTPHALDRRGASVEEQDNEPVCECGHALHLHWAYMHLYNPQAPRKCTVDGCGCEVFRPPNGK